MSSPSYAGIDASITTGVIQCACERAAAWRGFEHAVAAGWRSTPDVSSGTLRRVWSCPDCAPSLPSAAPARHVEARPLAVPLDFAEHVRATVARGEIDLADERTLSALLYADPDLGHAYLEAAVLLASEVLVGPGAPGASRRGRKGAAEWWWWLARDRGVRLPRPTMPKKPRYTPPVQGTRP